MNAQEKIKLKPEHELFREALLKQMEQEFRRKRELEKQVEKALGGKELVITTHKKG